MAAAGVTLIDLSFASTVVLIQIVALDLVLGGDNAVVVALASRRLPENLVGRAALLGAAGAVLCRFLLATVATSLLQTPFVKIAGGGLLIAVALSLLSPRRSSHRRQKAESALAGPSGLWRAVGLILVADVAMSLDNVVAVAALANGDVALLALGLALSVPAIVFGGVLLGQVARRSPSLTLGAAVLIAWIGGSLIVGDAVLAEWVARQAPALSIMAPLAAAIFIFVEGRGGDPNARSAAVALAPSASFVTAPTPLFRTLVQAKRTFAGAAWHRESSSLHAQPLAPATAAFAEAAAVTGEASEATAKSGEDRVVLLGLLAMFLLVGAFVLWALLAGDGVLDARG